jgi:hypothetical protein
MISLPVAALSSAWRGRPSRTSWRSPILVVGFPQALRVVRAPEATSRTSYPIVAPSLSRSCPPGLPLWRRAQFRYTAQGSPAKPLIEPRPGVRTRSQPRRIGCSRFGCRRDASGEVRLRADPVRPHHLVVFVLDDVAVPDEEAGAVVGRFHAGDVPGLGEAVELPHLGGAHGGVSVIGSSQARGTPAPPTSVPRSAAFGPNGSPPSQSRTVSLGGRRCRAAAVADDLQRARVAGDVEERKVLLRLLRRRELVGQCSTNCNHGSKVRDGGADPAAAPADLTLRTTGKCTRRRSRPARAATRGRARPTRRRPSARGGRVPRSGSHGHRVPPEARGPRRNLRARLPD